MILFRRALNQYGWEAVGLQDEIHKNTEFCAVNNGENAILICNDLIIDILRHYFNDYD